MARAAAEELQGLADRLAKEGGEEAAHSLPYVFHCMDAISVRATAWEERRKRQLDGDEGGGSGSQQGRRGEEGPSPEERAAAKLEAEQAWPSLAPGTPTP